MTDDNPIRLSRRRVLGGLGAIGIASAGAGLGTTAYFSDDERFVGNSLTAGELDLKLDYRATYAGGPDRLTEIDNLYPDFDVEEEEPGVYLIGEVPDVGSLDWDSQVQELDLCDEELNLINGDEVPVFNLTDVKPGDYGEVTISLHICDNPSWLWMNGELTENAQNGYNESERDSSTPTSRSSATRCASRATTPSASSTTTTWWPTGPTTSRRATSSTTPA